MHVVSKWMYMQTKSRYTYGASLIVVGVVCCVVATGVIMMDMPVKKRSETELPFVLPPKRSAENLVVSMGSRFTERDLNTPGPIRDTYVEVGSGPFAKPGNHTHGQRPGSHFTFSGFADIAGTSSQDRVAPKEMPPSSNRICSRTRICSRPSFKRFCIRQAQNGVEEPNVNDMRLSNLAGGSGTVEVTNLQLVTPALTRCSAMLNVGATVVDLVRNEIQKQVGIRD